MMCDIVPVVFCSTTNDWVPVSKAKTPLVSPNRVQDGEGEGEAGWASSRISTLNILADCFPWMIELAIRSKLRYAWLVQEVERLDATVLCLNEATLSAIQSLMASPWVRANYFASEWGNSSTKQCMNGTLQKGHGCFVLSKVPFDRLCAFSWNNPSTICGRQTIVAGLNICGVPTVMCATHTAAYQHNHKQRDAQIAELKHAVESNSKFQDRQALFILGDLNLHSSSEDGIVLDHGFLDMWAETHFADCAPWNDNDPGYTFDSATNKMIPRYIPGEVRRMRLDRILMRQNSMLKAASRCVIWANASVDSAHPDVFPSDHYGLSIDVERTEEATGGSSAAAGVLKKNAVELPLLHNRSLYANTVAMGVHCIWLSGKFVERTVFVTVGGFSQWGFSVGRYLHQKLY
eukprot:CAMPEP_0181301820 /NCGR_PEP_ID=MMETSP1101-20121128/7634_1 /TAXON_ID=46948 /ORGANISM="Rhodomonas abbreviata, Strain Caron Lab Isolate" /LENGTH=403 /DNA_ID=CAMNT_0023407163 /DNA_START=79 /DNA_END=1290 /DNA_ORIENTATION=+